MKDDLFLLYVHDREFRAMMIDVWPKEIRFKRHVCSSHHEIGDVNHLIDKKTHQVVGFHLSMVDICCPELLTTAIRQISNVVFWYEDIYIMLNEKMQLEDAAPDGYSIVGSYLLHNDWNELFLVIPKVISQGQVGFPLERAESFTLEA